jgi:hypothetical protein
MHIAQAVVEVGSFRSGTICIRDASYKGCMIQGRGHIVMDPAYIRFNSLHKVFRGF